MDDLERRLLILEMETKHERELSDSRFDSLSRRLQVLETNPLTVGSMGRILLAIGLPVAVWLLTGDLRKALAALRMMGAG
jgi:hypothetical protein